MAAIKTLRTKRNKKAASNSVAKKKAIKLKKPAVKKISAITKAIKKAAKPVIEKRVKINKIARTYLNAKELAYFKELIVEQKTEILENARRLRESLVDENTGEYVGENTTFSMHMAEHGTDEMEREKTFMFIQRDEKHLFYLENALERIEKKTYGLCVSCGKPIDKGRLEAVPITQHCIKCKTSLSNGN
ncbi:MAG: molecular chaperone DnaK [Ignavibacteriae bacterium]|nr:MAG: molecular chaperone DnaK [Ignavibacteriota bacterium]